VIWGVEMKRSLASVLFVAVAVQLAACNNPFSTRTPAVPPSEGGAAILPATSPEKVLHNLEESVRAKSIQDYLDVFSDDFIFSPDPGDSLAYEQDFQARWTKERESEFALNFFQQAQQDSTFSVQVNTYAPSVYHPGETMYEYFYKVTYGREGDAETVLYGKAWLYFKEGSDGKWTVFLWVDHRVLSVEKASTWGVLRARYS